MKGPSSGILVRVRSCGVHAAIYATRRWGCVRADADQLRSRISREYNHCL